ncbi:cytochrome c biogenesis CcdA family protein [Flexivirga meconopsidis]|uniref:cytochrome c biogenesis CcdA family protein n=1 Tax=Flexivirga meconopsidis TaxID=2977121 RepID=UPI00223F4959
MNGLLTLAFTGGLLAPLNPCGFALLPAYLTHTLADQPDAPLSRRLGHALGVGTALALGFAATLATAGLAISAGAHQLIRAAPWLGFGVGLLLIILGLVGFIGRGPQLRLRLPTLGDPGAHTGIARWALFGVGYAAASLACTFGVLLAVIAQAQATTGFVGQLGVFAAYAAGSIALLLVLSAAAALTGAALTRWVRALARQQARITAGLLVITGAYVAVYWWPAVTGRARVGHGLPSIDRWSAATSTWLQAHTGQAAVTAGVALALVLAVAVAARASRNNSHVAGDRCTVEGHTVESVEEDCCAPAPAPSASAPNTARDPGDAGERRRMGSDSHPVSYTRRRARNWKEGHYE